MKNPNQQILEITSSQLKQGYYEKVGEMVYHREYQLIKKINNNTYIVHEPKVNSENCSQVCNHK